MFREKFERVGRKNQISAASDADRRKLLERYEGRKTVAVRGGMLA